MTTQATNILPQAAKDTTDERQYLNLTREEWLWPLASLLCLSMVGLAFPLGYLGLLIILINRFKRDRYDFLIIITIWFGGYAFIGTDNYPFKTYDLAMLLSLIGAFVLKKTPIMKKVLAAYVGYAALLFLIAYLSEESMRVQFYILRTYLFIIYFTVPMMLFANHEFDIKVFYRRLLPFVIIICIFYTIDCVIFSGNVLIPNSHLWGERLSSRFYRLAWSPFSFTFMRKYPPGLFWLALCIIPVIRYYKLKTWQWVWIALALLSCRTFTVISGLIFIYIAYLGKMKKALTYIGLVLGIGIIVYFLDASMGYNDQQESTFRISSSINQLTDLSNIQDEEDFAKTGSGRMAQAIPKIQMVFDYGREWIGLGFLHPEKTKNPKYILFNEYYTDIEQAEEVSTGIEIESLQLFVTIGYLGLIGYILFYGYLCWLVRKCEHAKFFYSVIACMLWFGIGGFASLSQTTGLILAGLSFGIVLLSEKNKKKC